MAIVTDLHLLAPALMDSGQAFEELMEFSDGRVILHGDMIFRAFLEEILKIHPHAVLVTGDMTFNGERKSHELLAEGFAMLNNAGISVLILPGNHDLDNLMAGAYTGKDGYPVASVTKDGFLQLYRRLRGGRIQTLAEDPASMSYVCVLSEGLWLLCIDVNGNAYPGKVSEETLLWAQSVLRKAGKCGAKVIGASHQNVLAHNQLIAQGYVMIGAEQLLALYRKYKVSLHLSGHMHIQHWKQAEDDAAFTEIVTSALCMPPCQYGVLELSLEGYHYHSYSVDVASYAKRQGLKDQQLLNFPAASEEKFLSMNRKRVLMELKGPEFLLYKGRLADGLARLDLAYYSGRLDALNDREDIRRSWKKHAPDSFWNLYLDSIFDEAIKDETNVKGNWKKF